MLSQTHHLLSPEARYLDVVFLALCAVAFVDGVRVTGDLEWPGNDLDMLRNIAHAQTIADGDLIGDPHYRSETIWYNPLGPFLVAGVSILTETPVYVVYTRIGAYLNLLAPICFYWMVTLYFDRWVALAGGVAFLFLASPEEPAFAWASYSPWLLSQHLSLAPFLVTLVAFQKVLTTEKNGWRIVVGILWGVTFLGHTAPALILGAIAIYLTFYFTIRPSPFHGGPTPPVRAMLNLTLMMAVAFLCSIPYSYSILWNYGLLIINDGPPNWIHAPLRLDNLRSLLVAEVVTSWFFMVAAVGFVAMSIRSVPCASGSIFIVWLVACLAYIAYGYVWQYALQRGVRLPSVVPSFHFLFYARLLEAILFGAGLVALSKLLASLCRIQDGELRRTITRIIVLGLVALLFVIAYPSCRIKREFVASRVTAQTANIPEAVEWIRQHCHPSDVFLTSELFGLSVVGPAGRKVVAINSMAFSNPFVDWKSRMSDANRMLVSLEQGNVAQFQRVAAHYDVKYTCILPAQAQRLEASSGQILHRLFSNGELVIHQIRSGRTAAGRLPGP